MPSCRAEIDPDGKTFSLLDDASDDWQTARRIWLTFNNGTHTEVVNEDRKVPNSIAVCGRVRCKRL